MTNLPSLSILPSDPVTWQVMHSFCWSPELSREIARACLVCDHDSYMSAWQGLQASAQAYPSPGAACRGVARASTPRLTSAATASASVTVDDLVRMAFVLSIRVPPIETCLAGG
ncbi:MAG: hypothetical protein A3H96_10035 [Acidobacteria bacterium RIFCSPLOWO2_02_FULL_67_36]|nr:MAG: hypothetical protein A3H96_10035 [Acidobacteria bacterium RIFCSPLOWO2_02_FULL_67_36]